VRAVPILASVLGVALVTGCASYYDVPIELPIQAKLDVTPFSRVLVAGFVAGGEDDVDANLETVRLLRSQLRTKSSLKVIDADVLPLQDLAMKELPSDQPAQPAQPATVGAAQAEASKSQIIRDEKRLDSVTQVFANADYWKKIGEEFQGPLIVTGTVHFQSHQRSGYVQREQEVYDAFGRRRVVPVRTYMERKGFILKPKFVFIDGRTGATLYSETFREEVLYNAQQSTPALSSYFELMDRLLPSFLTTLSTQKIRGTRTLLK
jgi:hypothetical protein